MLDHVLHLEGEPQGDEYKIMCPNPLHNERNPSCSVNLDTGYWSCFSCGVGGDLGELVRTCKDVSLFEAQQLLKPSTNEGLLQVIKRRLEYVQEHARPKKIVKAQRLPGPYDDGPMRYLNRRGLTDATIKKWGVRYVRKETLEGKKGPFTIEHSIAMPIRDRRGHLLSWCYRATDRSPRWQPRYVYTPGTELSELWYGMQLYQQEDVLCVLEGGIDSMWVDQCGFPSWGMLGSKMGVQKILRLTDHKKVVLLADNDDAGYEWVKRVTDMVGTRVPLFIGQYRPWMLSKRPDPETGEYLPASDPEELLPVDVEIMVETALPYIKWKYL